MTPIGKAREARRDRVQDRSRSGKPLADDLQHDTEPADFSDDDEVGPQGGYGGSGPDQGRSER
jgi:hypothetical protein